MKKHRSSKQKMNSTMLKSIPNEYKTKDISNILNHFHKDSTVCALKTKKDIDYCANQHAKLLHCITKKYGYNFRDGKYRRIYQTIETLTTIINGFMNSLKQSKFTIYDCACFVCYDPSTKSLIYRIEFVTIFANLQSTATNWAITIPVRK